MDPTAPPVFGEDQQSDFSLDDIWNQLCQDNDDQHGALSSKIEALRSTLAVEDECHEEWAQIRQEEQELQEGERQQGPRRFRVAKLRLDVAKKQGSQDVIDDSERNLLEAKGSWENAEVASIVGFEQHLIVENEAADIPKVLLALTHLAFGGTSTGSSVREAFNARVGEERILDAASAPLFAAEQAVATAEKALRFYSIAARSCDTSEDMLETLREQARGAVNVAAGLAEMAREVATTADLAMVAPMSEASAAVQAVFGNRDLMQRHIIPAVLGAMCQCARTTAAWCSTARSWVVWAYGRR